MRSTWGYRVLALVATGLAALAVVGPATAGTGAAAPLATVDTGVLRGATADGVDGFLGVPYARPPVGPLRWHPPQPATAWAGVRDALTYGSRCAQPATGMGSRWTTEDCLYLNVWRPAGTRPGARLPVYLWIHGGGLLNGGGDLMDGRTLARSIGAVVVTINYRLGVFGFLAHPALTRDTGGSGDYGLMDQQAALRWVRRNIAGFGGDARMVTIGGESAGAISVCAHLSAPGSRGLFARAVMESGSCESTPLDAAQAAGTALAAQVGCPGADAVSCLHGLSTAALLDLVAAPPTRLVSGTPALPRDPRAALVDGTFVEGMAARVPLLIGANRDEGRLWALRYLGYDRQRYEDGVRAAVPTIADRVLARYPWPATSDRFTAAYLAGDIITDAGAVSGIGGCPNRALTAAAARYTTVYAYEFDHPTGPGPSAGPAGYVWGAAHSAELAYLWPGPTGPAFTPAEQRLSADMIAYWGAFIHTGAPAAPWASRWAPYTGGGRVLSLRAGRASPMISDAELAAEHRCDLWDAVA